MLNERLRELRLLHNISQVSLAQRLGVTKQSVSNWENDNIQPSIEILIKISKFFSVSTDYLLGLDNRQYLEITGLDPLKIAHIQLIINDMK